MLELDHVHVIQEIHLIKQEILAHLPNLHGHLCVHTDSHKMILFKRTPTYVLYVYLLMQLMREYHLRRAVFIVMTGLLLASLWVVPNKHTAVSWWRHKQILARGRPFNLRHLIFVIAEIIDEVLGHTHVPDVDETWTLPSSGKEEIWFLVERDHKQIILWGWVAMDSWSWIF